MGLLENTKKQLNIYLKNKLNNMSLTDLQKYYISTRTENILSSCQSIYGLEEEYFWLLEKNKKIIK